MNVKIEESWKSRLQSEFSKPYFVDLVHFVKNEFATKKVFPPGPLIFSAFDKCTFDQVKVVVLGQDPYNGQGQANGLCFSVNDEVALPPSLINIFKEIHADLGLSIPQKGNLEYWSRQGVLLLNSTLTVRGHQSGSHQNKGWEIFTDKVIEVLSDEKEGLVFLLWGAYAQQKGKNIDPSKHLVLKSAHPSPYSADRGFFGNKHFSLTNEYLLKKRKTPIDWSLGG